MLGFGVLIFAFPFLPSSLELHNPEAHCDSVGYDDGSIGGKEKCAAADYQIFPQVPDIQLH